jgi:hypothetical protein
MKHGLIILTNALPLLCAAALMFGAGVLAVKSLSNREAEVRQIHQEIDQLNIRLHTLEGPQR